MTTRAMVLFALLMLAAAAEKLTDRVEQTPISTPLSAFPMEIRDWQGTPLPPFSKDVLDVLRPTDYLTRVYRAPALGEVGLYIGYWQSQRQGDTIHSPLNCLPGSGWEPVSQAQVSVADPRAAGSSNLVINRYLIQKGLDRELVLYWYQSHGRITASEYWSRFYLVADAVRLNRTDGAIVRVIAPIRRETAEAEKQADAMGMDFVSEILTRLDGFLPK